MEGIFFCWGFKRFLLLANCWNGSKNAQKRLQPRRRWEIFIWMRNGLKFSCIAEPWSTLKNLSYFLTCFFSFLVAGVGAENQAEEGANQGKRDGSKTGGITFKSIIWNKTQDRLGVCWKSMDMSAAEDNLDFQPLVSFLHFYGECYAWNLRGMK